jgi:Spy/CpxP family protein refolding chaperone
MKFRTLTTALVAILSLSVFAADSQLPGPDAPDGNPGFGPGFNPGRRGNFGNRRGPGFRGGRRGGFAGFFNPLSWMKSEIELRNKFPKEYAQIDKAILAEYDKIAQLAKKANIEYKEDIKISVLRLRLKYPQEFVEIDKLVTTNPRELMQKIMKLAEKEGISLFPNRGRRQMNAPKPAEAVNRKGNTPKTSMRELRNLYPEEMKKIFEQLRSKDKNVKIEARKQLMELDAKAQAAKAANAKTTTKKPTDK